MKNRIPAFAAVLCLAALAARPAVADPAKPDMAIAAVVGGDAITSYDVDNRIKFIIATAKLSNTPDVIEHIRPQVIRSLIDEKLQMQEADRNDIKVTDDDVKAAIAAIEEQRGMPPGTITHILEANHVPGETFTHQIRAQLAWNKLLMKKVRPKIRVSDEEIQIAGKRVSTPKVRQELKIAVITLPVEKPSREQEMLHLGQKLVKEIHNGASFEEVSRQFSSGAASAGGKIDAFWVLPEQLDPAIARALAGATAGTVTSPVRTAEGFTIIKVYDTHAVGGDKGKETQVYLKEILLKLKPDAGNKEADVLLQIGEDVAKHPGTCDDQGIAGVENLDDFDITVDFKRSMLSDLPPALKVIVDNLKVGDISTPFASYEGIRLYMLCDRKDVEPTVDREHIYAMLMQQKMALESEKYMRTLRRETFIDVR